MPPAVEPMPWLRQPQQARTRRSFEAFLDSAQGLLGEREFDAIGVGELARHAGSSVGAFYRRFRGKEAFLHVLHERGLEAVFARAQTAFEESRWRGSTTAEVVEAVVAFLLEVFREQQALQRAVQRRARADPQFRARASRLSRELARRARALLLIRRGDFNHPDPHVALDLGLNFVVAVLGQRFSVRETEPEHVPLSEERLAAELTRAWLAYLGVRESGGRVPRAGRRPRPK